MATILTFSYDLELLATRNLLLSSAGHFTISVTTKQDLLAKIAAGGFDLLVVCYSVPDEDWIQVVSELHKRSEVKALLLRTGAIGGIPRDNKTAAIQYTPERFIEIVESLVGGREEV